MKNGLKLSITIFSACALLEMRFRAERR